MRLRSIPNGKIVQTDLELMHESIPIPADGQVVVKTSCASIDPTHRIWMNGSKKQYMDAVQIGDVMRAVTVGVITDSKHDDWPVGTRVVGFGGICDYYLGIPGVNVLEKCVQQQQQEPQRGGVDMDGTDLSLLELSYGSILIGLTAWYGVNKIMQPGYTGSIENEVVVISGGAGAVGSIAGQLCKLKGATVIGIAGGPDKCRFMTDTLGYDYAIDYKASTGQNGMDELDAARTELLTLKLEGKLIVQEDVREGIENYVDVVNLLFTGGNKGKLLLQINHEE